MAPLILDYAVNHRVAGRTGNRSSQAAPHGAYRCRGEDRWCAITVFTDDEWESFSKIIGKPVWTASPKFATLRGRKENEDELDKLVEEWTVKHPAEEVMTLMQTAGVAAGVVYTAQDLLEHDPQLRHRRYFRQVDHPEIGKHHIPRSGSFLLSNSPVELRRGPLLGEHNDSVLKRILADEEIAELVIQGVIA